MLVVFVAVLFSNAVMALSLLVVGFQLRAADERLTRLLTYITCSSMVWSLGSGLMLIQADEVSAHIARCIDLMGTVSFMVSCIMILGEISTISAKVQKIFVSFSSCGYLLWFASILPGIFEFNISDWGMSFEFKNKVYAGIYLVFFIACALCMLVNIIYMLRSNKKSVRLFATSFFIVWIIILTGSFTDMLLPIINEQSAPGSSIAQFWGLIIVWYAIDNVRHSNLTVKNMSLRVYDAISTPVIMADIDGNIKVCNESAVEFFELTKDENGNYGNMYLLFTLPADADVSNHPDHLTFDAFCNRNNVYCNIRSNTIKDRFNDTIGYISLFTDLSTQLEYTHSIESARTEAISANKAKSLFLANMSHEIRTPVNAIMGFADIAISENTNPQISDYLSDIKNASQTLLSSINDILNISKIESGKMELVNEEYSLRALLYNVHKIISVQAESKKLSFAINLSGFVPTKLYGDDVRIQEILINLCNNAVKYTKEGSVWLNVCGRRKDDFVELTLSVKDTGIGIKPVDVKNLFSAYERMDKEKNHRTEGTGLGLSIVHGYVNLMGGTIDVKSEYGVGSEFIVTITQKILDDKELSLEDITRTESTQKRFGNIRVKNTRLMVVDDNRVNLKVITRTLEKYGIAPDSADSGKQAIEMARANEYPIILMDHMMPEMDGVETMSAIRKISDYYKYDGKIVVLTANAIEGVKQELLAAGFDDYLSKPLNYSELERVFRSFVAPENIDELD